MSGDWLGPLILLVGFWFSSERKADNHPLSPWHRVGDSSKVYVVVENHEHDTLQVFARAPAVDGATRFIGSVPPCDSNFLRLPYVDAVVTIQDQYGRRLFDVKPTRPGIWRARRG